MTLRTNARVAGVTFLLYIVTYFVSLILFNQASHGAGTAAKLASIAQHAPLMRLSILLTLLQFLYPMVLAVTIFALTRDQDPDLALLAAGCRFAEGVIIAMAASSTLELLSVATSSTTATGPDAAAVNTLGTQLLNADASAPAFCFVVGSTIYCYLFLRARSIPVPLAWLGVVASVLFLISLSARVAGLLHEPVTNFLWIPMAVFEVALALWLIIKGVAVRPARPLQPAYAGPSGGLSG